MADRARSTVAARSTSSTAVLSLIVLVTGYIAVQLVAGAPDSPLVPALPRGVGVPAWTARGARALRLDRLGPTSLTLLTLAVIVALVCAFLVLVRESWRGRVHLAPVLAAGALSITVSVAGPVILSRDVYSYAAYGRMFALHDANPYVTAPSAFPGDPFTPVLSPEWTDTRSVYGPTFILVSAGIVRAFPDSPVATIRWFKVLAGTALAGATLLAVASCRKVRRNRSVMAAAVVGLNPVLVVHTVGGGHNDALVALLLAGALWLALPGQAQSARFLGPTVVLTFAALVKLPMVVALLVWVWWILRTAPAGRRSSTGALHAGVIAATAVAVTAPLWAGLKTLRSLSTLASVEGWASAVRLVARGGEALARAASAPGAVGTVDHLVRAAFLVVYAVAIWRLLGRGGSVSAQDAWGASLLLLALAIPYLLPWYAAWFLLFVPLLSDDVLAWIGLAASLILALTGIPAEPGANPGLWRDMVLGVHYWAAPLMLGLFVLGVARVMARHPTRTPASEDLHPAPVRDPA